MKTSVLELPVKAPIRSTPFDWAFLSRLHRLSIDALHRMYLPQERLFVFRLQRNGDEVIAEGTSPRYTAITLLGLADESPEAIRFAVHGAELTSIFDRLVQAVLSRDNVGDIALALWVGNAFGYRGLEPLRQRMLALRPLDQPCPTVELSWVLMASCLDKTLVQEGFVHRAAKRLLNAFNPNSGVFSHVAGAAKTGLRAHVSCFADFVYPIQALSEYHKLAGDEASISAASRCADQACLTQGEHGQWWWHYDYRTGEVIEGYPVYTVHQHGMGPMALFALSGAGGEEKSSAIAKSLAWLSYSPEISGSTVDDAFNVIWRKVARREPRKLARKLQAAATSIHPSARVWGTNWLLPPRVVDFECRPYELGWLLYAWKKNRSLLTSN